MPTVVALLLALLAAAFPASAQTSPYAARALKVLAENRFESHPWQATQAATIKNGYGLEAYRILAENFSVITEDVLRHCAEIDNPLSLAAFKALAERYSVLQAWQVRWAAEVNTSRELAAYRSVVQKRHTEQGEAEAALLDGLKSESHLLGEKRWSLRRSRSFEKVLAEALEGLSGSCRMRLSGAEVRVHDLAGPDVPDGVVARYRPPVSGPRDEQTCGGDRPGRLSVYMTPFLATHAENDSASLRDLLMKEMGCRAPQRRSTPSVLARAEGLRDALASKPRPKASGRSCAVRRFVKPRIVSMEISESYRRLTKTTEIVTDELDRVADPSAPAEAAPAAR